jgi:hypothetical protein
MDGQGQLLVVLRRCRIKQCHQLTLVLALAKLEVAKRASLSGRLASWEEPWYLLQTVKLRVDCREERTVNCSKVSLMDLKMSPKLSRCDPLAECVWSYSAEIRAKGPINRASVHVCVIASCC